MRPCGAPTLVRELGRSKGLSRRHFLRTLRGHFDKERCGYRFYRRNRLPIAILSQSCSGFCFLGFVCCCYSEQALHLRKGHLTDAQKERKKVNFERQSFHKSRIRQIKIRRNRILLLYGRNRNTAPAIQRNILKIVYFDIQVQAIRSSCYNGIYEDFVLRNFQ